MPFRGLVCFIEVCGLFLPALVRNALLGEALHLLQHLNLRKLSTAPGAVISFSCHSAALIVCCEYGIVEMIKYLLQISLSYLISALRQRGGCRYHSGLSISESKLNSYPGLIALQCV